MLRDASVGAIGAYIATAAAVARGLLLAKLLAPEGVGTVATVGIVLSYSLYADVGILNAVERAIPLSAGAGAGPATDRLDLYGLGAKLFAGILVALGLLLYLALHGHQLSGDTRFGISMAALIVPLQGISMAQQAVLRARRAFASAARLLALMAILNLLFAVAGAIALGTRGVFLGQAAAFGLTTVAGFMVAPPPPLRWPSLTILRSLIGVGWQLALLSFVGYNLVYIDQVMILKYLSPRELGLYTIVLSCGAILFLLPTAVAGAIGPRLLERYGRVGTIESIADLCWRPAAMLSLCLPLAVVALGMIGPLLIQEFLPTYQQVIGPLRVYLVGMFYLSVNLGVSTTLLAINKHRYNIPILFSAVAVNITADAFLVGRLGLGLMGIALGSTITYTLYWLAHATLVRWYFEQKLGRSIWANMGNGWPGLLLAGLAVAAAHAGTLGASRPVVETLALSAMGVVTIARWHLDKGNWSAAR